MERAMIQYHSKRIVRIQKAILAFYEAYDMLHPTLIEEWQSLYGWRVTLRLREKAENEDTAYVRAYNNALTENIPYIAG